MKEQEDNQKYVEEVLRKVQAGDGDLSETELALGRKYHEVQQAAGELGSQANVLEKEIRIKNGQLEAMKDQIKREFGRGGGILESLLALRPLPEKHTGNGETKPQADEPASEEAGREADA